MKMQGVVTKWNSDKAFGFIESPQSSQEVFFHIRDFSASDRSAPRLGLTVEFEMIHVGGKGPRGMAIRPQHGNGYSAQQHPPRRSAANHGSGRRATRRWDRPGSGAGILVPLILVWAVTIAWGSTTGLLPRWGIPALLLINLATFYLYWWDKSAASNRRWRTSESALQLWGLAGGWPAAWVAQQVLRHKSTKESFRSTYHFCVGLHCVALICWVLWKGPRDGLAAIRALF